MKTAIVYYSKHHGNTKKLLEAIAERDENLDLFDITANPETDLSGYDRVGFASGIYYSKFNKNLLQFAKENMPANKPTFFIYTYGAKKKGYTKAITEAAESRGAIILGEYGCFGFNTFGPFKLFGAMAKGHPNEKEIEGAIEFYKGL